MLDLVIIYGIGLEQIFKGIGASPRRWRPNAFDLERNGCL